MNSFALTVGWIVIAAVGLTIVTEVWWRLGELVYKRVIPLRWREGWHTPVPGARPLVSRRGLVVLSVLSGPRQWRHIPRILRAQKEKRDRLAAIRHPQTNPASSSEGDR